MTFRMVSLCFFSIDFNILGEKLQKNIVLVFFRFSNSQSSNATSLLIVQNLYLSKMGYLVKVICCLFDHAFLNQFDGKYSNYHNARALLVLSLSE